MTITDNFVAVIDKIESAAKRAGRDADTIRLVTVTKTVDLNRIREAVKAGAHILGENRVQEAGEKIKRMSSEVSWHLIGQLQTNKVKYAVKLFDMIHSVDTIELAAEIDRCAAKIGKVQSILIEVSLAGEKTKAGVAPEGLSLLVRDIAKFKNVSVKGLMAVPPFFDDPERVRPYFRTLKELASHIAEDNVPLVSMRELSMGMSTDFEAAIEEGATLVRVGTAIFGDRH